MDIDAARQGLQELSHYSLSARKSGSAEAVKGFTEYLADDYSIIAYKLVSVKGGYNYDVTWFYK